MLSGFLLLATTKGKRRSFRNMRLETLDALSAPCLFPGSLFFTWERGCETPRTGPHDATVINQTLSRFVRTAVLIEPSKYTTNQLHKCTPLKLYKMPVCVPSLISIDASHIVQSWFTELLSRSRGNQEGYKQNKLNLPMWEYTLYKCVQRILK